MTGNFFIIDRRVWVRVCDLGMNAAVAYLVLACGSGGDNQTTAWSTTALHKYCGIAYERAKAAIQQLVTAGIVRHGENHTRDKPRYVLLRWDDIPKPAPQTPRGCTCRRRYSPCPACEAAAKQATTQDTGEAEVIWVPNALVTGTTGEQSPVARVRASGDVWALRMLVDLYYAQNLRDDGGISPYLLWQGYDRQQIGQQGIFACWAFRQGGKTLRHQGPFAIHENRPNKQAVWESEHILESCGLLTFVPHLFESNAAESREAEILHPYGIEGVGGEPLEIEIGKAAHAAAEAMALEPRIEKANAEGFCYLAPIKNSLPNVQMIGVARLRYRPHTRRTADWWGDLNQSGRDWIARYNEMRASAEKSSRVSFA